VRAFPSRERGLADDEIHAVEDRRFEGEFVGAEDGPAAQPPDNR
jgi:hypothetical protein